MIIIDESNFGYWPNAQMNWFFGPDEMQEHISCMLEQFYAQMVGWA